MATTIERETYPRDEVTEGVGLSAETRVGPSQRARLQRGAGGVILAFCALLFIIGTVLLMFGMVPVALAILALIPLAALGGWLRRRGADRMTESNI